MSGTTPQFGWPTPQSSDKIAQIATIVAGGIQAIENSVFVATDSKSVADLYSSYPKGISLMALTTAGATSGGWPELFSSMVVSLRRGSGGDATAQFHIINRGGSSNPTVRFRNGNANGWTDWLIVAGVGMPSATASGTFTFSSTNTPTSATVAFPSGRFSSAPNVVATTHDRGAVIAVSGISSTGFTIALGDNGGSATLPSTQQWFADWIAMTNYS